jgi:hypothetical protein
VLARGNTAEYASKSRPHCVRLRYVHFHWRRKYGT